MSIKYDVYENPRENSENVKLLHARIVNTATISTQQLAKQIEFSTSLTQGDVKNVLTSLSYQVIDHLTQGRRVHIEGLGYFQLSISSPLVKTAKEMRGDQLKVKTIKFLPEKQVKAQLGEVKFERNKRKNHSLKLSSEEINMLLEEYFNEHTYITRAKFELLCGLTRGTALNRIKELIEQGKLVKGGVKGSPIYELKK